MRLIGAGLPRTGTLSQKTALEMLGLDPCYHMVNVLSDLGAAERWRAVMDGELAASEILDGFEATVDWPGSHFVEQLVEQYPDAKVLLSVRTPETWARSMYDTVWAVHFGNVVMRHMSEVRNLVDPQWKLFTDLMKDMWRASGLLDDADPPTIESLAAGFERHTARVREIVPADRLLVWSPADGWEPICELLELPVPDAPFPRVNDTKQFETRILDPAIALLQEYRASLDVDAAPAPA